MSNTFLSGTEISFNDLSFRLVLEIRSREKFFHNISVVFFDTASYINFKRFLQKFCSDKKKKTENQKEHQELKGSATLSPSLQLNSPSPELYVE